MDTTEILAWSEGAALAIGGVFISFWKHNENKNKALVSLELARIEKQHEDFTALQKRFDNLEKKHEETLKLNRSYLENFDVVMMQWNSVQDVMHCIDPIMKHECAKQPNLAMVYERWKNVIEQNNDRLGGD